MCATNQAYATTRDVCHGVGNTWVGSAITGATSGTRDIERHIACTQIQSGHGKHGDVIATYGHRQADFDVQQLTIVGVARFVEVST